MSSTLSTTPRRPHIHTHTHTHIYIYIYIYIIMSCRQHGYSWLSLATSPYYSSPLASLQGYILCPHIAGVCKFALVVLLFAWPYVGVYRGTSLMSSSLLLQQCPACLVRLTCIVFVMWGKWPYSWCLVGCCRQDLFNIYMHTYIYYGGARGVMVIVVGNGNGDTSSNPRRDWWHFTALISLGKVWIQLFSSQLWVSSRADWFLQPWWGN